MTQSIAVFLGPTLRHAEAAPLLGAHYHPPVAMGDLYRVSKSNPDVMVIIDGMFGDKPSVMHQEIMYCLSLGITIWGASSMGALRAAELAPQGMRGWGEVFQLYQTGQLQDDDEVAVAHAPEELGWQQVTLALVDIRFAVSAAVRQASITGEEARSFLRLGKQLHYANRTFEELSAAAQQADLPEAIQALLRDQAFFARHSAKRRDAITLLAHLAHTEAHLQQPATDWRSTAVWLRAMQSLDQRHVASEGGREICS
jgi:hypothetical protein